MSTPWIRRRIGARLAAVVPLLVVIFCGACSSPDFGDLATNHGYLQATGDHVFFLQWVKKGSSISGTFQDDDPGTGNSSVTFPLTGTISGTQISVTLTHLSGPRRTWNGSFTAHGLNLEIGLRDGAATAPNWTLARVDQVNSAVQHLNSVTTRYFPSDHLHFPESYSVTSVTGTCPSQANCLMVLQVSASSSATTLASADVTWKALFNLLGWTVVRYSQRRVRPRRGLLLLRLRMGRALPRRTEERGQRRRHRLAEDLRRLLFARGRIDGRHLMAPCTVRRTLGTCCRRPHTSFSDVWSRRLRSRHRPTRRGRASCAGSTV